LSDRILTPAHGTRNDIFRSVLKAQANLIDIFGCDMVASLCREPKTFRYYAMCRVNHGQSFLKELAKELRRDPASQIDRWEVN
jgi:hypothetical protein